MTDKLKEKIKKEDKSRFVAKLTDVKVVNEGEKPKDKEAEA